MSYQLHKLHGCPNRRFVSLQTPCHNSISLKPGRLRLCDYNVCQWQTLTNEVTLIIQLTQIMDDPSRSEKTGSDLRHKTPEVSVRAQDQ
jgi:hypothetical protein